MNETMAVFFRQWQNTEITDHHIYARMANREKNIKNKAVLRRIANDELEHAKIWQRYTNRQPEVNRLRVWWLTAMSYILGYTFVIKIMEKGEDAATKTYKSSIDDVPELVEIVSQEQRHEQELLAMLDEERLRYVGSMVLGMNDALVELTGTLAGLTLALANNRLIALAGIITGASATLSMAASNYLAERSDGNPNALTSSIYTGAAYLLTVVLLVAPYLVLPPTMVMASLAVMLGVVVFVLLGFTYYISVAKSQPFIRRFLEMAAISLGVAAISFVIGLAASRLLGLEG